MALGGMADMGRRTNKDEGRRRRRFAVWTLGAGVHLRPAGGLPLDCRPGVSCLGAQPCRARCHKTAAWSLRAYVLDTNICITSHYTQLHCVVLRQLLSFVSEANMTCNHASFYSSRRLSTPERSCMTSFFEYFAELISLISHFHAGPKARKEYDET
jgi:hypothetical protein